MAAQGSLLNVNAWESKSVKELEEAVRYHNAKYWIEDAAEISDPEFDKLVEALRKKAPESPVLSAIGPAGAGLEDGEELDANSEKIAHDPPMLSLDKCYDEDTLKKWFEKFKGEAVASPKVDGVAICLRYDASGALIVGATRGSGTIGEVITDNVKHVVGVPHSIDQGPLEVRGEAYMPLSVFEGFKKEYMSPRNLTAGALKRKDGAKTASYGIHFFAYDVLGRGFPTEQDKQAYLRAQGFEPVPSVMSSREGLQQTYESFAADRQNLDYETDGVVFKANDTAEQQRMGSNSHHPRFAIAYKYQGDSGQSVLREIEWGVSRTGSINPVGIVDPVDLSGATVTRVSLHNLAIMEKLGGEGGLKLGSTVLMMRRGGVIPNLESVISPGDTPVVIPAHCPICGAATERRGDFLFADHNDQCASMRVRQLEHFVKVFDMKGFGQKWLEQVYEEGLIVNYEDFFTVTQDELMTLDRMGETLAKKLIATIDSKRTIPVELFLRAFGIHELGRHVSAILASTYQSLDEIFAVSAEDLAQIHTIGEVIAKHVTEGLAAHREAMERVLEHVTVTFPDPAVAAAAAATAQDGPLAGKSFLFTGTLEAMTRKDAQAQVESLGGQCPSSVSKTLDYLVIGDADMAKFNTGWRSSKLKKAEQLIDQGAALQIIAESDFLKLINP